MQTVGYKQELTYGETEFWYSISMFHALNPKKNDVFYDIGCGSGKPLIQAALAFNDVFSVCKGIEI